MTRAFFILASLALLLAVPRFADMAFVNAMILVFIASLFAMAYNLLWGQAGLISFGHATYFAFGASTTIMMMEAIDKGFAFPTPLLPLVGAGASFAIGLVAGWFATIRTGVYFAMITVAISELAFAIVQRWDSAFGGEAGLTSVRSPWGPFGFQKLIDVYYFTFAWAVIGILFLWLLQRSPLGMVIRGVREQEERVRFLGYDTHALKTLVFAVSAGLSGMAGALLAFTNESTNVTLYEGHYSTTVLVNAVIGGAGVFFGPVVGATLTTLFGYYVANMTHYWLLYMGILFMIIVLFAPRGLTGLALAGLERMRGDNPVPARVLVLRALGIACLAVGVVLTVEIVGEIVTPAYDALSKSSRVAWPAVRIFGIAWTPSSPVTVGLLAGLYALGIWLLRGALPAAAQRAKAGLDRVAASAKGEGA